MKIKVVRIPKAKPSVYCPYLIDGPPIDAK